MVRRLLIILIALALTPIPVATGAGAHTSLRHQDRSTAERATAHQPIASLTEAFAGPASVLIVQRSTPVTISVGAIFRQGPARSAAASMPSRRSLPHGRALIPLRV